MPTHLLLLAAALASAPDAPRSLEGLEREIEDLHRERSRALVRLALEDAVTRSALDARGLLAGWDDGFTIRSADGAFRLDFSGQLQVDHHFSHAPGAVDENRGGFENRRTKVKLSGAAGATTGFVIGGSYDRRSGELELSDAWLAWNPGELELRAGNFRPWFLREGVVSAKRQPMADRSLIAKAFGLDRDPGLGIWWTGEALRLGAALQQRDEDLAGDRRWRTALRGDLLLAGEWKQLRDITSFPDAEPAVALGAAVLYLEEDPGDRGFRFTADVSVELGGAHLLGAYVAEDRADGDDSRSWGVLVEGGVFLRPRLELVARGSFGDAGDADGDLAIATIGLNLYLDGHRRRLTVDGGYGFDAVSGAWASSSAGWRESDAGQVVIRTQLQLLF